MTGKLVKLGNCKNRRLSLQTCGFHCLKFPHIPTQKGGSCSYFESNLFATSSLIIQLSIYLPFPFLIMYSLHLYLFKPFHLTSIAKGIKSNHSSYLTTTFTKDRLSIASYRLNIYIHIFICLTLYFSKS